MSLPVSIDVPARRDEYRSLTRVQLPGLLPRKRLRSVLSGVETVPGWMLVTRLGGRHVMLDAAEMEMLDPGRRAEFERHVVAGAREGFQYLYDAYPLYGKWHAGTLRQEAPALADMFEFLNSDAFLDPMRELLDAPDIGFVDAQLTRYRAGHFLTEHDDSVDKGNRIAAYVLSLSSDWKAEWGGQLQFLDTAGAVTHSFVPRCNTLSVFRVPQPHLVTQVASYARGGRISITGWFRAGDDPGPGAVG
ncbi:2OG-Fe(II) oxygenase family protein [Maricaulis sp.]|uniref:2OG-Fe(II) oxygenase n=1 Tax=Maricaulis sp. TaxID=1486257 RepID=UPI00261069C7|nr:2OG-Fe(II) oxygenase family protein [Maricaulis sp.]